MQEKYKKITILGGCIEPGDYLIEKVTDEKHQFLAPDGPISFSQVSDRLILLESLQKCILDLIDSMMIFYRSVSLPMCDRDLSAEGARCLEYVREKFNSTVSPFIRNAQEIIKKETK